jgi:hypothetical protein
MKYALNTLALVASAQAALRFGCSTVTIQRLDPVVEPGNLPSAHLHQVRLTALSPSFLQRLTCAKVVGGNAFSANMTGDIGEQGTCTTCVFSEDFSNYWTAVLFFKHQNGTYKRVPIMANDALPAGINGGMTIYYTQQDFNSNGNKFIRTFPPVCILLHHLPLNARIDTLAGFPYDRRQPHPGQGRHHPPQGSSLHLLGQQVHAFSRNRRFPQEALQGRHHDRAPLPRVSSPILPIQHTLTLPSCWDGKNLDSPDHQAHMYDTQPTGFAAGAACPSSHPIRMPQLAYETLWDTAQFKDMWPKDGSNPFVFSYGAQDGHAYGTHADYMFGWKGDSLQRAMNSSCMFNACENGKPLKSQSVAQMNACKAKEVVNENTEGWLKALPGQAM